MTERALRLDQHTRWCRRANARGRGADNRAPALGLRVGLEFAMVLHFQAIQPGQQDQLRQPRGEKADRAARDDRDDPVAPGESFEERDDPRQRLSQVRVCDDGRQRPV